jgi:hypothetical protein
MKLRVPVRQGDVLIIPIPRGEVPKGLVAVPRDSRGRVILAEGEVTGHAHAILDDAATLFRRSDLDEMADRFLAVECEVAEVVHEEHATITLPGGDYIVRQKREYQPEAPRYVAD